MSNFRSSWQAPGNPHLNARNKPLADGAHSVRSPAPRFLPSCKSSLDALKRLNPVKIGLRLPESITFTRRFFPIALTKAFSTARFASKNMEIACPESAHRCISRNSARPSGVYTGPAAFAPVIAHPCRRVKNEAGPESAHVLSRRSSPASPKPITHTSRRASLSVP